MKKRIILPLTLVFLIGVTLLVSATINLNSFNGSYDVEIQVGEGWNIIAATLPTEGIAADSEIQLEDIKAAWLYTTKFGELSPSGEHIVKRILYQAYVEYCRRKAYDIELKMYFIEGF